MQQKISQPPFRSSTPRQRRFVATPSSISFLIFSLLFNKSPNTIGDAAQEVPSSVETLIKAARVAATTLEDPAMQKAIVVKCSELVDNTVKIISASKNVAQDPNPTNKEKLAGAFKEITHTLGGIVSTIRDAAVGEKECREAADDIARVQADLESAVIFAETGQLDFGTDNDLATVHKKPLFPSKISISEKFNFVHRSKMSWNKSRKECKQPLLSSWRRTTSSHSARQPKSWRDW